MKYSFYDDYSEGVDAQILDYICQHNLGSQLTYGRDEYSELLAKLPNATVLEITKAG